MGQGMARAGKRLAALLCYENKRKLTRQRTPGKEKPVPAVGEANE